MHFRLIPLMVFTLMAGVYSLFISCSMKNIPVSAAPAADTLPVKAEYYKRDFTRYENYVYEKNIRTVRLFRQGFEGSLPLIELNTSGKLQLDFDDLNAGVRDYYYTFVHCDAGWQPTDIQQFDYISGYLDERVSDYRFSFNTLRRYTHYTALFPNEDIRFTKSGNYLLKVYADNDQEHLIITRRFMVFENIVSVKAGVHRATVIADRNAKQEIDFTVYCNDYVIDNPFGSLRVVIMQNGRWDNPITGLKPLFVKDRELVYDYEQENVFNGGNEFRNFDIRSLRFQTDRVRDIVSDSLGYRVYLLNDARRSTFSYSTLQDINGRYYIKIQEGRDNETEPDYAEVHFSFPYEQPPADGNFYVFGALTDWNISPESQMKYNYTTYCFECTLYLKQGYYNYEYVFMKDGSRFPDETPAEGNHYETENNYDIFVYNKPVGSRYDQLIGYQGLNTLGR